MCYNRRSSVNTENYSNLTIDIKHSSVLEKLGDELLKYELTKQLDEYDDQFSTRLAYFVFVLRRFKYTSATIMTYGDMARLRDISNINERSLRMNFSSDNSSTNSAIVSIKRMFY